MPPKNSLMDMHNILMAQLERLDEASGDELKLEISRTRSMADMATTINENSKTMLEAMRLKASHGVTVPVLPESSNGES